MRAVPLLFPIGWCAKLRNVGFCFNVPKSPSGIYWRASWGTTAGGGDVYQAIWISYKTSGSGLKIPYKIPNEMRFPSDMPLQLIRPFKVRNPFQSAIRIGSALKPWGQPLCRPHGLPHACLGGALAPLGHRCLKPSGFTIAAAPALGCTNQCWVRTPCPHSR